jgi:exosome complex component RRP45
MFRALDKNSLCVVPGKLAWKIVIDINIIINDGNLYDACMMASLASWISYKIPFLRKTGNTIDLSNASQYINLSTLHVPLSVTFGLFDNNQKFIVDPSLKEEKLIDGIVIISANKFGEICYLHTYGSVKVDRQLIQE